MLPHSGCADEERAPTTNSPEKSREKWKTHGVQFSLMPLKCYTEIKDAVVKKNPHLPSLIT